jgi:flavin reductase (DIM6/NTAB) family NADH-FMN oxidoreductase RutF
MIDWQHQPPFRLENPLMKTTLKQPLPLIYPVPIVLAGALVEGTPNYITIGDTGLMGIKPPLVFISSHVNHHTNAGIVAHQAFSINIPSTKLLAEVDYCGIVSGVDVDKSTLFTNFFGELETVPMIEECLINLECKLVKEFRIQHRQIFIGEVAATHIEAELLVHEGERISLPSLEVIDPILYALDNHYYKTGAQIGIGYHEGQTLVDNA